MNPGKFITLEGVDGAGKSTHLGFVADWLRRQGREVVVTREPGGTPLGETLRELLLHREMDADTELLLMFAARQEHLAGLILPALARGAWVVSDRFTDASYAYQCGGRGIPADRIATLEAWVQRGFVPDLTLLFDVPPDVAETRRAAARTADRFEREASGFFSRVRNAYLDRARAEPGRIRVLDARLSIADLQAGIGELLQELE
ncbi:MAG: dTMP kinase [Thiobacillus sp. 63-78]|uniref:dTMP kinase n=1 Tax=Thiobacillus sp. 63-78 TaxID=1895859 RepID=UPI00095EFB53|nr:dTMP kinase [Thiobacillus sp. 63-78]MBN8762893.1 dTMP kinase [Thiobacillus sp.]MBN8773594.1 dTMP kinase [Thiobacillus sp.]OJZ16555.1 MAG: dTMP kinase [Thiobacillus sp. 63-78]